MARIRTADHLRSHLSVFEEERYPIQKGYIARLLFVDDCSIPDVLKKVTTIVMTNDPGKDINKASLRLHVARLKKLVINKRHHLTKEWPSLITLFLQPLPIPFKSLPVASTSSQVGHIASETLLGPSSSAPEILPSTMAGRTAEHLRNHLSMFKEGYPQPVDTSVPSSLRNPDPPTSLTFEMLLEPGIPVTSKLMQPMQNSTTNNSPSCLMTWKLPSPRKLKSYCASCVNKQRTIMNVMQKNTYLIQQIKQFKPLFEGKNIDFSLTRRLNETIRRKTQSITNWKTRYASLSKACRDPYNLKLVQSLEQQVKILEGKLTASQEKNIYMASANERLESLLVKTENDNVNLKHVHEQLKYILEKAEDNNVPMKQVHEQLKNVLGKVESDDAHLKRYSQASHSPEMGIKEESPWEAADNCGDNFALQNDEIKQEDIFEEHPERNNWKETSASDDSTAISKDVTADASMKHKLSGERCQVKAQHDCLDHGPPIYIDNAEVPCEQFSNEDEIQTITAEGKVDQPNLYSENEAASLYPQLCYVNSHTAHTENGTHQ